MSTILKKTLEKPISVNRGNTLQLTWRDNEGNRIVLFSEMLEKPLLLERVILREMRDDPFFEVGYCVLLGKRRRKVEKDDGETLRATGSSGGSRTTCCLCDPGSTSATQRDDLISVVL